VWGVTIYEEFGVGVCVIGEREREYLKMRERGREKKTGKKKNTSMSDVKNSSRVETRRVGPRSVEGERRGQWQRKEDDPGN